VVDCIYELEPKVKT